MDNTPFTRYAAQWAPFFQWFEDNPGEVGVIYAEDFKHARSFRQAFYSARTALMKDPVHKPLYPAAWSLQASITEGRGRVVFTPASQTVVGKLLAQL